MILTSLNDKFIYSLLAVFLFLGISQNALAQDESFAKLKAKFEEGQIFQAGFLHESIDSYTQDTVARTGDIWVGENQYKVLAPNQTVVVDGKTSKVYDENRNRVIISKYEPSEDDFAPSRILNGIDSTFTVETQEQRDNEIYIRLASDDPFAIYKKVEIYLNRALIPQKIRAVDPVDNIITTTFRNGRFVKSTDQLFTIDYPDDAEVVDMRN